MTLPPLKLDVLRSIPAVQKVVFLALFVGVIVAVFYFYIAEPKTAAIEALDAENARLENEIQTLTIKAKHLDELVAANKQLELDLAKKKERLPPEEEAVMLLKQVSDLGERLGLSIKLWKPNAQVEDPSKLFVKMPVNVEATGAYHTAALFFDRINRLQRIITVSGLKMGSPKVEQGRVVSQAQFDLVAYAAPADKPVAPIPAVNGIKPVGQAPAAK